MAEDALGQTISIGDKIIYAAVDGRSAAIRRGVVVDIYVKQQDPVYGGPTDHVKLTVDAEHQGYGPATQWRKLSKVVHLGFTNRVVVVDSTAW